MIRNLLLQSRLIVNVVYEVYMCDLFTKTNGLARRKPASINLGISPSTCRP